MLNCGCSLVNTISAGWDLQRKFTMNGCKLRHVTVSVPQKLNQLWKLNCLPGWLGLEDAWLRGERCEQQQQAFSSASC